MNKIKRITKDLNMCLDKEELKQKDAEVILKNYFNQENLK